MSNNLMSNDDARSLVSSAQMSLRSGKQSVAASHYSSTRFARRPEPANGAEASVNTVQKLMRALENYRTNASSSFNALLDVLVSDDVFQLAVNQ